MSNVQYLFCLETNPKSNTDWQYIKKTIDYLLADKESGCRFRALYMEGKNNYKSKPMIKSIKENSKKWKGDTEVVYCIDLDKYDINQNDYVFYNKLNDYCERNGYKLVYFCRDIEEVYLGKRVESSKKAQFASRFFKNGIIDQNLISRLSKDTKNKKTSNLLLVLSEITDFSK